MTHHKNNDTGRVTVALILISLGVMAFMGLNLLWPFVFILAPGLVMLWIAAYGGKAGAATMAVPGMIIAGTGAMLFVQNLTGYWDSWAYSWTLYGVFLGMGLSLMGKRLDASSLGTIGRWFVVSGLVSFGALGVLFELLIYNRGPLGPVLLIVLGLFLLTRSTENCNILAQLSSDQPKAKRKMKAKNEDKLFAGPVVHGTRVRSHARTRVDVVDVGEAEPTA